jgi:mono/diheme cytochrome c family protein
VRHLYTQRLAYLMTAVTLTAAVVFGAIASRTEPAGGDRIDQVLELEADPDAGLEIYTTVATPTCGSCHSMAAADAVSDRASDLDQTRPDDRRVVVSLVTDGIGAHAAQGYRSMLSDQQVADVAAFVAERAGDP